MSLTIEQLSKFFDDEFPHYDFTIEELADRRIKIRRSVNDSYLRPGGTVSGPFMMTLADVAMYTAILNEIGLVALAVTTNLNINFFHRPSAKADMLAECQLLKVGQKLIVGEVSLFSEGSDELVAHAVATYAIPPANLSEHKPS